MKRSERRHLKENALAASVALMQQRFESHRRQLLGAALVVVLAVVAGGGYLVWRQQIEARAAEMLVDAMITAGAPVASVAPPQDPSDANSAAPAPAFQPGSYTSEERRAEAALEKFLAAAEAYPDSPAGVTARYLAGATLAALGRREEAERQYEEVIGRARDQLYGRMALLGLAEARLNAGKYDSAIELLRKSSSETESNVPVDAVLMQLGHAYVLAGRTTEAQETFTRIVDEFPNSLYEPDARTELEKLEPPSTH